MAKDYAKYKPYQKSRSYRSRVWIILSLALGLLIFGCILFFFKSHHKQETLQTADKLKQKLLEVPAPKPPEPEFDFYNILPQDDLTLSSQSVGDVTLSSVRQSNVAEATPTVVSSHLKKPLDRLLSTTPEQVAIAEAKKQLDQEMSQLSATTYILVLGNFQDVSQAEQCQAQALLRGFSVQSKVNNVNGVISYQIFMGPYSSLGLASPDQKRLNEAGIQASLLKLK